MILKNDSPKKETCTVAEAAERLGVGQGCAYNAIRSGHLPAIRIRGRLLIPLAALDRMLAAEPKESSEMPA